MKGAKRGIELFWCVGWVEVSKKCPKWRVRGVQQMQGKKILIFGDSFVKIFTASQNKDIEVHKFKGATIKGLTKPTNKNRLFIEGLIRDKHDDILGIIFNFGQVDYNFTCYYKLVNEEDYEEEDTVASYFNWIHQLNIPNKLVIAVYPSPLSEDTICGALLKYMILSKEEINQHKEKILVEFRNHSIRHQKWTQLFKVEREKYKSMKVIDLTSKIVDKNYEVRKEYLDINKYNIHLLWKKLILDLQIKLDKYVQLNVDLKKLDESEKRYEQEKKIRMKRNFNKFDF